MKSRIFIGRTEELERLEGLHEQDGFRFAIITGRRRVGKTRLIKEFLKDKDHFRIQFEKRTARYNLARLNNEIGKWSKIPPPNFSTLTDAIEFLSGNDPKIIVLDEFSYLIRYSDALAEFQTIVDEILAEKDIMLIVSGSSYSIMKRGLLEYSSPLYGRSDMMLNVLPLTIRELDKWFPGSDMADLVMVHSALGGIPRYLEFLDSIKEPQKKIESMFFDRNSYLFREAKEVLEEEFDDPSTYYAILESISKGSTTVTDIGHKSMVEPKNVAKYLDVLMNLGIIRREFPFRSNKKRGIYRIRDPYFAFWFKFISPHFEDIDSGYDMEARSRFKRDFFTFVGYHLEMIASDIVVPLMPFKVESYGRWWHKGEEIDLIIEGEDIVCFLEVKWGDISKKDMNRIIEHLRMKAVLYPHRKDKVIFGILSRNVVEKTDMEDLLTFGLNEP
ncbi:MAG: ATP-binding protein [Candidatus Thermoplasmatota archaeon]|nr:ATP-binding protein [Candidatus Thermoplasmatota archaeon]